MNLKTKIAMALVAAILVGLFCIYFLFVRENTSGDSNKPSAPSENMDFSLENAMEEGNALQQALWDSTDPDPLVAARSSCVWITAEGYSGSGVIYDREKQDYVIATAAHILENVTSPEQVEVTFPGGEKQRCEVIESFSSGDCAFLWVNAEGKYPVIEKSQETYDGLVEEKYTFLRDYQGDNPLGYRLALVVNPYIYVVDFDNYLLLLSGSADPGMSGCAVLDENGVFLGILVGANEDSELVALPYVLVESFYQRV